LQKTTSLGILPKTSVAVTKIIGEASMDYFATLGEAGVECLPGSPGLPTNGDLDEAITPKIERNRRACPAD
jgi:hypothetical protein